LLGFIGAVIIAYFIILGSYGFSFQAPPKITQGLSTELNSFANYTAPSNFDSIYEKIRPILIPDYFFKGLVQVGVHAAGGHSSYLLGQTSGTGWWYYFPVTILFKTPIPIFIFLVLSIVYFKKVKNKDIFDEYLLIIPPIIFLAFAMYSKADLGIRHILPIFPFIFVFISKTINLIDFKKWRVATIGFIILLIWYFVSTLTSFPNSIAYFNEFAGGPNGGYKILTDSNLDWGQDVFRIKSYIKENNLENIYLVYNWNGNQYLMKHDLVYPNLPSDRRVSNANVIISASALVGDSGYDWLKVYPKTQITPGVFLVEVN